MYKKVLITGGAGFVGSNIAIKYKEDYPDTEVISLDNLIRNGSEFNIERLRKNGVVFVKGDVRNYDNLRDIGNIDLLIECSAECSVLAGYGSSPRYLLDTNVYGAINCLEFARECGSDFVFLSTSRVYPIKSINSMNYMEKDTRYELDGNKNIVGMSKKGISEDFSLEGIRSFYGATKLSAELLLMEYIHGYGMRGIINRCGVLTGPWQMGKVDQGFIALWLARHIYNKKLSYIGFGGQGKQVRDILHVLDLYDVIQIQLKDIEKHSGKIYNIGGGYENSVSLKEFTVICEEITENKIQIDSVKETRDADVISYISDCSKFNHVSGWIPRRDIKTIAKDTAKWIMDNKQMLKSVF